MSSTFDYCTSDDVIARLSPTGVLYAVDDDGDEVANDEEQDEALGDAVREATAKIDFAMVSWIALPLAQDTDSLNPTLRSIATNLAAEWLCERKGKNVPPSISKAADRARTQLEQIREGSRVPGLVYPSDAYELEGRNTGRPRVADPGREIWGRRCS